jgi:branched-chain amino acid transport system permease protein
MTAPVLEARDLSISFGGLRAVDGVTLSLEQGKVTALLGPNGAGKTTIFNLVTGILRPDAGRVLLRGEDITQLSPHEIAQRGMARSFQDVRVFHRLSALQNVAIAVPDQPGENLALLATRPWRSIKGEGTTRAKAREALAFVGLEGQADENVGNMSFGDQKLVAIARLLATECNVLLLDEPTSGVDPSAVEGVIDVILGLRDLGRTICIVEHSVHFVERLADHVIFMDQGKVIAEGTMAALMAQTHLTEIYFGT